MQFNHDNMSGVRVAEELVNMLGGGGWDEGALADLLAAHLFHNPQVGAPEEALLRDWTTRLRAVFESDSEKDRCATVNALLEQGVKRVFLTVHDGLGPHLHFAETSDSLVERVRALTAGGLAIFITEAAGGRLGTCARDGCPKAFADTSRGGRRAYCSARCGNAEAVMRYRERGHYAGRP